MKEEKIFVPPDTQEIELIFRHPGGNFHLGFLVFDSLKRFRGWVSLKRGEKRLKISQRGKNFHGMYVPFGEWKIIVHTRDRVEKFDYEIGTDFVVQPRQWNWVKGEFHTHTVMSDGKWSLEELARVLKDLGVEFFFVTDHNAYGLDRPRYIEGISAFPGVEITSPMGHFLIFDVRPGEIRDPFSMEEIKRYVFGPAHPEFPNDPQCKDCHLEHDMRELDMDFVEIWNSVYEGRDPHDNNVKALRIWEDMVDSGKRISITAGGDIHNEEFLDYWMPTWVYVPEISQDAVLNSLKEGLVIVGDVKVDGSEVDFGREVELRIVDRNGDSKEITTANYGIEFSGERFVAFKDGRFVAASTIIELP